MERNIVTKGDAEKVVNNFEGRVEKAFDDYLNELISSGLLVPLENTQYLKLFFKQGVIFTLNEELATN